MKRCVAGWLAVVMGAAASVGVGGEPSGRPPSPSDAEVGGEVSPTSPSGRSFRQRRLDIGIEFVRIKGGHFVMGSEQGPRHERPAHPVYVPPFRISRTEVTVSQYRACVRAGGCVEPPQARGGSLCTYVVEGNDSLPINCISYDDALRFAAWVGADLPTEAQWEWAASGAEGRPYPWGEAAPSCERAVMKAPGAEEVEGLACGAGAAQPVCSRPAGHSPEGVCDLAGSLAEWIKGPYLPDYYAYTHPTAEAALAAPEGWEELVGVRGGSLVDGPADLSPSRRRATYPERRVTQLIGVRLVDAARGPTALLSRPEHHGSPSAPPPPPRPPAPPREQPATPADPLSLRRELGIETVAMARVELSPRRAGPGILEVPDEGVAPSVLVLSPFVIARTEVTVGQYRRCVEAGVCSPPRAASQAAPCNWGHPDREHHPVNCVTWEQADTFARWVGGALPTELQWERARWIDPAGTRTYPRVMTTQSCVETVRHTWVILPQRMPGEGLPTWGQTMGKTEEPCAQREAISRGGLCDMDCNVWEWTSTWYTPGTELQLTQTGIDPTGPPRGELKVLRGGSYADYDSGPPYRELGRDREAPNQAHPSVGFRVVFPPEGGAGSTHLLR